MKKKLIFLSLLIIFSSVFSKQILQEKLKNGMDLIVKENKSNNSVGLFVFVKTGSIHEGKYMGQGLSHYLEHIVSSGTTTKRTEKEYQKKLKEIGAITNAYTTYGITCYHIIVDKQNVDEALAILSENVMECAFNQEEIDREKDVIKKEFILRVSPPLAQLGNRMREVTFLNSNVKYEVIGYINLFDQTTREQIYDYYKRRYVPNNMIFVASGNIDPKIMMEKAKTVFSGYERGILEPIALPEEPVRTGTFKYVDAFDVKAPRGYLTTIVDRANYEDFTALEMAANLLFDKRNAPVRYELAEKEKLVNWIGAYFNSGGHFPEPMLQIVFEGKKTADMDKITEAVYTEIRKKLEIGFSKQEIKEYLQSIKASKILKEPGIEDDCNELGWNMITYGNPDPFEEQFALMEKITPKDLERVIRKYFLSDNKIIFYGIPQKDEQKIAKEESKNAGDFKEEEINENLTFMYKNKPELPIIDGAIYLELSDDYETKADAGRMQMLIDLMELGGTKEYSSMDLSNWFENHAVTFSGNINNTGLIYRFKCLNSDFEELYKRIDAIFNEPTFDQAQIELYKQNMDANFQRKLSTPDYAYDEFRKEVLYKGQKAGISGKELNEIIQTTTKEDLVKLHEKFFKSPKIVVTLFGDLSEEKAKQYAKDFRDIISDDKISGEKTTLKIPDLNDTYTTQTSFEQVSVILNFKAPKRKSKDAAAMSVLNSILSGGFGGRLLKATRVDNNLVYTAYSYYAGQSDYGFFRISALTSLPRKAELIKVLKELIKDLQENKVSEAEIKQSVMGYEMMLKNYFTDKNLINTYTTYEGMGLGYDYLSKGLKEMQEVTPEDVLRVAKKYLDKAAIIICEPGKDVERKFD